MEVRHCHQHGEEEDVHLNSDDVHPSIGQTHDRSSEDIVRSNWQSNELNAYGNDSETTLSESSVKKDTNKKSFSFEDFQAALDSYKAVIDISNVAFILEPFRCTLCQQPTSLPLTTKFSQRMCDSCRITLDADTPLRYLHDIVGEIYVFWLRLRREELCDRIEQVDLPGLPTHLGFIEGSPGNKTTLPTIADVRIHDEAGSALVSHALSAEQRGLLEEVLLTVNQCHISLLVLVQLLKKLVRADADSPILQVREYCYQPKHELCYSHCVHTFTLKDGRHFAISFTDRQLGWYPLVVPWAEYLDRCVKTESVPNMYDLGHVHMETASELSDPDSIPEDERGANGVLQRERALRVADEVVGRWKEWAKKER
ncbi:hypothetical protein SLS60_011331 [Paraconiothyrium brasiliense]|uniref:Uncharacterized protein n=1 Tax=Paraconiothyrium brasiliense TaxID=300254 RepID=A0ABR3QJC2_9PLEO